MWIARDELGYLFLHNEKPIMVIGDGFKRFFVSEKSMMIDKREFKDVTFENSPQEVFLMKPNSSKQLTLF